MATSTLMEKISIVTAAVGATVTSLVVALTPAQALTLYTDRAAFDAASQSLQNIDFEGLVNPGGYQNYPAGLKISGVNFTGSTGSLFVIDPAYFPNIYDWGSGAVLDGDMGNTITATLMSGVTAVGSDIMSFDYDYNNNQYRPLATDFLIVLSNGEQYTVNSSDYPNRAFVGFTSDIAISSISFKAKALGTELDNFTFGQAKSVPVPNPTPVPEPASIVGLLVFSTLGAGSMLRRKLQQKA